MENIPRLKFRTVQQRHWIRLLSIDRRKAQTAALSGHNAIVTIASLRAENIMAIRNCHSRP